MASTHSREEAAKRAAALIAALKPGETLTVECQRQTGRSAVRVATKRIDKRRRRLHNTG